MSKQNVMHAALERALELGEVGLQASAYLNGSQVVDEWAGVANPVNGSIVSSDTLFPVFSVTKVVTAIALHIQAERGLVDYEAPVAEYWPEYGTNGKQKTTVRDILSHRSGAPQMPANVTTANMCNWDWMVERLAAEAPLFPPGTTNAYHSINWGWLIGEIVRRTDARHRTFGQFIREEICEPLKIDDLYVGLPAELLPRVATLIGDQPLSSDPESLFAVTMPPGAAPTPRIFNLPEVQQAEIPGAGGIMTAGACARFFGMLANGGELDGVRILSEQRLRSLAVLRPDSNKPDVVNNLLRPVGIGGYWMGTGVPALDEILGTAPSVICHLGAGGSIGWADFNSGISISITHNRMFAMDGLQAGEQPFISLLSAIKNQLSG